MRKLIGVVGSGMIGRNPNDPNCWSGAGYSLFQTLKSKQLLDHAFGVEVPMVFRSLIALRRFSTNRNFWRKKTNLDPIYYQFLTDEIAKNLLGIPAGFDFLQIGGIYDVPGVVANISRLTKSRVYSIHDGNIMTLAESPFFDERLRKYVPQVYQWEKRVYDKMDLIFVYSNLLKQSFVNDFGQPRHKVIAVGSGPNFEVPLVMQKDYNRQDIVFIGVDFERKGGPKIVEAFLRLRNKHPNARLHVVGPKSVPQVILNAPNDSGIVFHGNLNKSDETSRQEMLNLLKLGTLGVIMSSYDPFPASVFECMANGMPVIGPDSGAFPEMIHHNTTGSLIDNSVNAITNELDRYLSDSVIRRHFGENARRWVQDNVSWDMVVERMKRVIDNRFYGSSI